jgi:hypothetical protein
MKDILTGDAFPRTFSVDTKKVKRRFVSIVIGIFVLFLAAPAIRNIENFETINVKQVLLEYYKLETYIVPIIISLSILAVLWEYGKRRTFGFEWQIHKDGLRIFQNGHELKYIPWENVRDIKNGFKVIDDRDGSTFPITLSPLMRRNMLVEIRGRLSK